MSINAHEQTFHGLHLHLRIAWLMKTSSLVSIRTGMALSLLLWLVPLLPINRREDMLGSATIDASTKLEPNATETFLWFRRVCLPGEIG